MSQSTWPRALKASILVCLLALTSMMHGQATQPSTAPSTQPTRPPSHPMLDRVAEVAAMHIGRRHGNTVWSQHQAVQADLSVEFGGEPALTAVITMEVNRDRVRLSLSDGASIIRDGKTVWVSQHDPEVQHATSLVVAWPFFLSAPFQLQAAGAKQTSSQRHVVRQKRYGAFQLSFDSATKGVPAQTMLCLWDTSDRTLRGLVGSFDLGIEQQQASDTTKYVVLYDELKQIEGVTLPVTWSFWKWSDTNLDTYGERIGHAKISNIQFVTPDASAFLPPSDARKLTTDSQ